MKILITGATGMLGLYVMRQLSEQPYEIVVADRSRFDLAAPDEAYRYVSEVQADVILHLAAETDVDLCEREPQRAGIRNHITTERIAMAAAKSGAWLLYISTSNVFGGNGGLEFNELDLPMPTNYYGRSKLYGEQAVRTLCPGNHYIIRAGWMIGGGAERDHKFVGKIVRQLLGGATTLNAVADKFGSVTPAPLLAKFIAWAIDQRPVGTLHFSSSGTVNRFMIAEAIIGIIGSEASCSPVKSAMFPLSAPRPVSEGLTSLYLPMLSGAPVPGAWHEDLKDYVTEFL